MNTTMRLLADLICVEACGVAKDIAPLSLEDAKALYALAKRHDVAHIAASAALRLSLLPDNEKAKAAFEKESFQALYRYERNIKELSAITDLLETAKIRHLPLKGSVIRAVYPAPWMRNSCDIDILIHEEDIPRAKELLLASGYTAFAHTSHDFSFDSPIGVHVELHFRLLEDGVSPVMQAMLQNVWEHTRTVKGKTYHTEMTDAMFYYYHMAHMAKHYLHGGCGIRPFLDIWMLRNRTSYDEAARKELLEAGGLLAFANAAETLSDIWFGDASHTKLTERMETFVLAGGIFGTEETRVTVTQGRRGGKLGYALSRIFLPYHSLKYHYPSLQKHKWLLPFFEVRRWCKLIFCGGIRRSAKELKTNAQINTDTANEAARHLSELGL